MTDSFDEDYELLDELLDEKNKGRIPEDTEEEIVLAFPAHNDSDETSETETSEDESAPAEKKKKSKLPFVLIGAALIALIAAGVLFWFAVGQDMLYAHRAKLQAEEDALVEEVAGVMSSEEVMALERYVNLKKADLTGSTCYDAILMYTDAHPDVQVIYDVPVGEQKVNAAVETLTLPGGSYSLQELQNSLCYLPKLRSIHLDDLQLSVDDFTELQQTYPDLEMSYSVKILGRQVDNSVVELNLGGLHSEDVEATVHAVELLPQVVSINFMDSDGSCALRPAEVSRIMAAAPVAQAHYSFDLFGQQVSTEDEEIIFTNARLSDADEETLREALNVLTGCKRFVLDMNRYGRISHEIMAKIREDYRDTTKVVWRVWFATYGSCLTDRDVIRFVYNLTDSNCSELQYCEDAEYIDFGHNEYLTDCSWVSKMTKLKAIILSGSPIKDLEPFATCESLEMLEIANCGYIKDVSPLVSCKNLKQLNISYTKVRDLSPLDDMDLEKVVAVKATIPQEEKDRLQARVDEEGVQTLYQFTGYEYAYPWRYEKDGRTKTPMYEKLCEVFNYPNATDTSH